MASSILTLRSPGSNPASAQQGELEASLLCPAPARRREPVDCPVEQAYSGLARALQVAMSSLYSESILLVQYRD
jgi:hypothetical protein